MTRHLIDLSVSHQVGIKSDPPAFLPWIDYVGHDRGAIQLVQAFPGLNPAGLPGQEGWAVKFVQMITHAGTIWTRPIITAPAWTTDNLP
ncbi:hypothetical protein [Acidocella facilis]|uniref:hypothetical protein n=1 Tax=Acidocella facilis TaxID=525 RepID=UPI0038D20CA0